MSIITHYSKCGSCIDGWVPDSDKGVQRCDECKRFEDDDAAFSYVCARRVMEREPGSDAGGWYASAALKWRPELPWNPLDGPEPETNLFPTETPPKPGVDFELAVVDSYEGLP